MGARSYTVDEADRALAVLRPVLEDVRRLYVELRGDLSALKSLEALEDISSDVSVPPRVRSRLGELQECLRELDQLDARLIDPELGLVSLPGAVGPGRRPVRLCWKLGEERVRFWFPEGEGYEARRPLPAPEYA